MDFAGRVRGRVRNDSGGVRRKSSSFARNKSSLRWRFDENVSILQRLKQAAVLARPWHLIQIRGGSRRGREERKEEEIEMKRTVSILTAALFAGAMAVPAFAQAPATPASPAAPAAEASPAKMMHHHHMHHHVHHMMHHHMHHHMMHHKAASGGMAAPSPAAS
jgi:hypothetical protein